MRREPEVLAATRRDPGAEFNGALLGQSALVVLARFFLGPSTGASSASVASSRADVLPVSDLCLGGLPLGFPVDVVARFLGAFDDARFAGLGRAGCPDSLSFGRACVSSGARP